MEITPDKLILVNYQKLPYDVFNDIIMNADIKTLWQLYHKRSA